MPNSYAIIPAAGLSTRMGSTTSKQARKQWIEIAGVPIFIHTLRRFDQCGAIRAMVVPVRAEDRKRVEERIGAERFRAAVEIVEGGTARQDSVFNAVEHLALVMKAAEDDLIAVHDAVRPFIEVETIERALAAARAHGAAIVGVAAVDTVKQVERVSPDANRVSATLPREKIVLAQTPQVFRLDLLRAAFAKARADGFYATDEASLVEHFGHDVFVVPGSMRNWKITTPADLELAARLLT
ncbi:MAG TPA: 2-C-methyl-D-erythritol 4-phosphate cytidylyltransferase [Terriglobales bacterium]|nr:2-C-methyl-D-erythritol 4-phosphate cytidylyltransferase [Terriglobales bacterium]